MDTSASQLEEDDFVIEDNLLEPEIQSTGGLRMSATTDTLDSVILETTPDELIDKYEDEEEGIVVQVPACVELPDTADDGYAEEESSQLPESSENDRKISKPGEAPFSENQGSNISSYFAQGTDDNFFDSFGNATSEHDKDQLGTDMFMSIAISKSEEDIRISESNAVEIKESDVLKSDKQSQKSEDFPNLSSNDSFQSMIPTSIENLTLGDDDVVENPAKSLPVDEEEEEEIADIIHIRHREHKSSTSEPEPISFAGESDNLQGDQQGSGTIIDLAENKEFEEIMAQAEDIVVQRPDYVSQVSSTSDKSDSQSVAYSVPNLASSSLTDAKLHQTGPVVGTTPSQMSPMGTPLHHAVESTTPISPPPTNSSCLSTTHSSSALGTSPFHSLNQDIGSCGNSPAIFSPFGVTGTADDAFSSILSMSDSDRRHDAWIPSDATSLILFNMATNSAGTYSPTAEQLSTPGVMTSEKQGDPVRDLVLRFMGEQEAIKRSVLTVDSVTQDVDGLKKLIEAGCLRAAIDLTGRLLEQAGQGYGKASYVTLHTPHSLQLWFVRLSLMVKLRMFEQAEAEMRAFQTLDTPDLYFQFYPNSYPGRRGSMVCFSMRLLHAELPLLCGRSQESLDRLYYMMAVCNRIKANLSADLSEDGSATHMTFEARKVSLELWNQRELQILYKIAGAMLAVKDYEGALSIYNELLEKEKNAKLELKAGIGRIHLQMGNINDAVKMIKEVETESSKGDSAMPCFNLLNKGLVAMCSNNFHDAYQHFKSAVQIQPHNTCAVNNMAVCSLYLGRLKDALNTLEQLVHSDPANTLHEGVLFNLCTLYELETSRALHKKQAILDLVNKHKGDGFPVACLKMA